MTEPVTTNASPFAYILERLKEPSTWAGIAIFVGMFGFSPDTIDRVVANGPAVITAIATIIAIVAPSRMKAVQPTTTTTTPTL
jgi:hypothetical protein